MLLKLNIYNKKEIVKTYTADTYDLMYGTLEDFIQIIDLEKLSSGRNEDFVAAVSRIVTKGLEQLKPLILDIFEGITEEELRHTKTKELVGVLLDILKFSIIEIQGASTGKNA